MTKDEVKLQRKATALNSIRKLYHPLNKNLGYTYYEGEGSFGEQRDAQVQRIIEDLEEDLKRMKQVEKAALQNEINKKADKLFLADIMSGNK